MSNRSYASIAARLLVPALFFGYATVANVRFFENMFEKPQAAIPTVEAVLDGQVTDHFDSLYREDMPHRGPSIGLLGALRYLTLGQGRHGVVVGNSGWLFTSEEFEQPRNPKAAITKAARNVVHIRDYLAKHDAKLVLVPLPAKADVYRRYLPGEPLVNDMRHTYEGFVKALKARGIPTVDTLPTLQSVRDDRRAFLKTDTHWTPQGAKAVALQVGKALGPLSGGMSFRLRDAGAVKFDGDLTKFITKARYMGLTGISPEKVELHRARQSSDGGGIKDLFGKDETFPIVLVGTSYSANTNWSFADDLKAAANADVLNVAKEGLGPVVPMRAFLKSGELDKASPRVVVWEFPIRYLSRAKLWTPPKSDNGPGGNTQLSAGVLK